MNFKIALTAGACLLGLAAAPASAATQIVSGGKLTGATGVMVGGISYDVAFLDGTCASVYGVCAQSNFVFKTENEATRASQALFEQVFLDTSLGKYDTNPSLTNGCTENTCTIIIPYAIDNNAYFPVISNYVINGVSANNFGPGFVNFATDTTSKVNVTFSRFTLSPITTPVVPSVAAVPEPATWAMMMLGFGGMGYTMRRKAKVGTRVRFA